jgi:hypothetical protein
VFVLWPHKRVRQNNAIGIAIIKPGGGEVSDTIRKTHYLKTYPNYFRAVKSGQKTFELRLNDRDFQVGDTLILEEYQHLIKEYTGEWIAKEVTYVLQGGQFGLDEECVILGLKASPAQAEVSRELLREIIPLDKLDQWIYIEKLTTVSVQTEIIEAIATRLERKA